MIVSPSMSLVAAGVASGICFLIFTTIRKGKTSDTSSSTKQIIIDDGRCACCLKPFLVGRGVRCSDCGARSCRKGCSRWETADNAWHCLFCHQQRSWLRKKEKWFDTFGGVVDEEELHRYFSTAKSRVYVAGVENAASSSELSLATQSQDEAHTMEKIRDFVEKVVEGLIGNVDETPIDRLYNHPEYDKLLAQYIAPLAGALARLAVALQLSITNKSTADPPTMAHTALREIVERAVDEARKLPGLASSGDTGTAAEGRSIAEQSYEDLLATAILNKVIEKFQREQIDGNSNVLHGRLAPRTKCVLSESEMGLDEGVEEGCSSLEPLSQDECSSECSAVCLRHRNQPERLSLTIEERIEEVTTTYTSDEEHRDNDVLPLKNTHRVPFPELGMDIVDPSQESEEDSQDETRPSTAHVDLISPIESWEENWLFQRKRVPTQADPVSMLVPNSSTEFKALIGDKDAEDTSDLSECSAQSDEEIEKELMEAINNVVPRSPTKKEFGTESPLNNPIKITNGSEVEKVIKVEENKGKSINETQAANKEKTESLEKTDDILKHNGADVNIKADEVCKNSDSKKSETNVDKEGKVLENGVNSSQGSQHVNAENETKEETVKPVTFILGEEILRKNQKTTTILENNTAGEIESKPQESFSLSVANSDAETRNAVCQNLGKVAIENEESINRKNEQTIVQSKEVEFLEENPSNVNKVTESSLVSLSEDNITSGAPKTPASTPTRTSLTEAIEESNNAESLIANEENVLNSLECAKKKLMVVDDNAMEVLKVESESIMNGKLDFQTEDAQQESEYTEHYDMATQRHLDSLTKTESSSGENEATNNETKQEPATSKVPSSENDGIQENKCREAVALAKAESASYLSAQVKKSEEQVQLATPPRPGTIAEREHKKWENAPPIENNPYSEESIQRRLLERQFARRASDIPGIHSELPKSNGGDLEVILMPHEPDIKRFSRDYYINNSKVASGDRSRKLATSISSRPSSSLSQRSNSTGTNAEQEQQDAYEDCDSILSRSNEVAKWQRNNSFNANDALHNYNADTAEERYLRKNESYQRTWDDQRVEDILENERKNSKNEINAKLNNQESNGIIDSKNSYSNESEKKIRRIDLKAYGFENEICLNSNKTDKTTPQRVVNKLDLKSFGYDGGLRRSQSNNQLESAVREDDFKPRIIKVTNKSNLTCNNDYHKTQDCHDLIGIHNSGDNNFTQSTDDLNKLCAENYDLFGSLKSAKSVPNVGNCEYYSNSSMDQEEEELEESSGHDTCDGVQELDTAKRSNVENGDVFNNDSENESISSLGKDLSYRSMEKLSIYNESEERLDECHYPNEVQSPKLPMPSVKRLAEAFSKQPESMPVPSRKTTKPENACKERSSTPEIHLVETPRQMHSLTARSLSKKFREGLRQIPNKVTSPPASHFTMEQARVPENQTEVVQSQGDTGLNDTDVISPGKLKSNIIFWEQMQRRS